MRRIIGFALFFIAIGILIMMLLQNIFIGILLIITCVLTGYSMFCC